MARKKSVPKKVIENETIEEEELPNEEEPTTSSSLPKLRKLPPEKFVHQGHMFTFIKISKDGKKKYWRCDKRGFGCKVRIHTLLGTNQIVKQKNEHNHIGDEKDVVVKRLKAMVKVKAHQTTDKAAKIIKSSLLEIPNGSSFKLDRMERRNLSKIVHRERKLASNTIKIQSPGITVGEEEASSCQTTSATIAAMRRPPPAKFFHSGYTYNFIKVNKSGEKNIWRCSKRAGGCHVRIHTNINTNAIVNIRNTHNHEADELDVEMKRLRAIVKVKALQSVDTPTEVIESSLYELPHGLDLTFAQKTALVKLINRERRLASWTVKVDTPNIYEVEPQYHIPAPSHMTALPAPSHMTALPAPSHVLALPESSHLPAILAPDDDEDDDEFHGIPFITAPVNPKAPYQCVICQKGFITSSYLNTHMSRTHAGAKIIPCLQCNERFNNENILRRHVKSCH